VKYLNERESVELLDLKKKLGFDDPRFHVESCDLCGNSAFREGYKEPLQTTAFDPPPQYAGYLARQKPDAKPAATGGDIDMEALIKVITEQVVAALGAK